MVATQIAFKSFFINKINREGSLFTGTLLWKLVLVSCIGRKHLHCLVNPMIMSTVIQLFIQQQLQLILVVFGSQAMILAEGQGTAGRPIIVTINEVVGEVVALELLELRSE